MKQNYSFTLILLPLFILVVLASGIFIQRAGIQYQRGSIEGGLQLLPQAIVNVVDYFPEKPVEALVLFDSSDLGTEKHVQTVFDTLDSMRVKYQTFDVNSGKIFDLSKYQTVVISFLDLGKIEPQILSLVDWVESGGRALFSIRPKPSATFNAIYHKLGIISKSDSLVFTLGAEFLTDLFPGAKGISLAEDYLEHESYSLQLAEDNRIHIVSADAKKIPLLWEHNFNKGRFVFINTNQLDEKDRRGIIGAAYSLLQDVFVYPVINTSVFFIDDFPSPVPAGTNDLITTQYGMDIQNFYTNIWWPDISKISKTYQIMYTGVIVETYSYQVDAPFNIQLDSERHKYFGSLNLSDGGEIGLHGFNHVPLCLASKGINQVYDYPGWPTTESMQLSVYELFRFAKSLFPDTNFNTYVPPSNILCSDSRLWLPTILPELKVIASLYLNNPDKTAYQQEFTEASDGIIELPRIVAGYAPDDFMRWTVINEMVLHYVHTHFVHPDDILSEERGQQQTWNSLRDKFEEYIKWIFASAPGLRNMTAREGAAVVQRFARLAVDARFVNGTYDISLGNFYDEAWLMLRTSKKPVEIQGGTFSTVTSDLYLVKATNSKVVIKFEGANP